ncbi:hypothetical protein F132_30 [Flavobacterium sp. phage 1/32]|nr:hypothetical protein F132_30 [Flavobacterium sp. phage 1/32]
MNTKANNHKKAEAVLAKFKGYTVPSEVEEKEAHLTHLIIIKSAPNTQTMEFEHTAKIVKLNDESLEATKSQFKTLGANEIVILHDGKEYRKNKAEDAKKEQEAKAEEAKAEEAKKADEAKAKDDRIAELEALLAKSPKAKADEAKDAKKEEPKTEETKSGNGKG